MNRRKFQGRPARKMVLPGNCMCTWVCCVKKMVYWYFGGGGGSRVILKACVNEH